MQEQFLRIPDFSNYAISNYGDIIHIKDQRLMAVSHTNHGHAKISLVSDSGSRHTRSVSLLVAQAFVKAPNPLCDQVVLLDGDLRNVRADNLVWRPRWFAWKYSQQLKGFPPPHYFNLPVANLDTGVIYTNIVTASTAEGLLYDDVWRSTYSGSEVYPNKNRFEIVERV